MTIPELHYILQESHSNGDTDVLGSKRTNKMPEKLHNTVHILSKIRKMLMSIRQRIIITFRLKVIETE